MQDPKRGDVGDSDVCENTFATKDTRAFKIDMHGRVVREKARIANVTAVKINASFLFFRRTQECLGCSTRGKSILAIIDGAITSRFCIYIYINWPCCTPCLPYN